MKIITPEEADAAIESLPDEEREDVKNLNCDYMKADYAKLKELEISQAYTTQKKLKEAMNLKAQLIEDLVNAPVKSEHFREYIKSATELLYDYVTGKEATKALNAIMDLSKTAGYPTYEKAAKAAHNAIMNELCDGVSA